MLLIFSNLLLSWSERLRESVKIVILFGITIQVMEVILSVNTATRNTSLNRCRIFHHYSWFVCDGPQKGWYMGRYQKKGNDDAE